MSGSFSDSGEIDPCDPNVARRPDDNCPGPGGDSGGGGGDKGGDRGGDRGGGGGGKGKGDKGGKKGKKQERGKRRKRRIFLRSPVRGPWSNTLNKSHQRRKNAFLSKHTRASSALEISVL